jgi:phosphomannomutase
VTLIKSISGIRGTIGGKTGEGLNPLDVVKFTSAYGCWVKKKTKSATYKVVIGRDARISGSMVTHLVTGTLMGLGIDVVDLDLSTTPTVEVAVPLEKAQGGITPSNGTHLNYLMKKVNLYRQKTEKRFLK